MRKKTKIANVNVFLIKFIILTTVEIVIFDKSNALKFESNIISQSQVVEIAKEKISEKEVKNETKAVYEKSHGIISAFQDLEGPNITTPGDNHMVRVKKDTRNTIFNAKDNPKERTDGNHYYSKPEDSPHAVYLFFTFSPFVYRAASTCSGSLLSLEWVLTSAHCKYAPNGLLNNTIVIAGATSLETLYPLYMYDVPIKVSDEGAKQILFSKTLLTHPRYDPEAAGMNIQYDIMLVKTDGKFDQTNFVRPIPLSKDPWDYQGYRDCSVVGFGSVNPRLHRRTTLELKVKKPCVCGWTFSSLVKRFTCVEPNKEYGICNGDFGAGLVCNENIWAIGAKFLPQNPFDLCLPDNKPNIKSCGSDKDIQVFLDTCVFLEWISKTSKIFPKSEISKKCLRFTETPEEIAKLLGSVMPKLSETNTSCAPIVPSSSLHLLNLIMMLCITSYRKI